MYALRNKFLNVLIGIHLPSLPLYFHSVFDIFWLPLVCSFVIITDLVLLKIINLIVTMSMCLIFLSSVLCHLFSSSCCISSFGFTSALYASIVLLHFMPLRWLSQLAMIMTCVAVCWEF